MGRCTPLALGGPVPMLPSPAARQVHKLRMGPRPMSHSRENWFARGFPPPPQHFLKFYMMVPIRKSDSSTPPTKANSTERGGRKVSVLKPAG
jgi:hypothetical protein